MNSAFNGFYQGKRILITGHTGFKGAWLAHWLLDLGAQVRGYSIDVPTRPSLFESLGLASRIQDLRGDLCDAENLGRTLREFKPDLVFHLAAQSLVLKSYSDPLETLKTNILGTATLLNELRKIPEARLCINVTSDKCYENTGKKEGYREQDPMGGYDPYSASKGCAELVHHSFFRSFFSDPSVKTRLASVRAGNVIGGGDWAENRIVPDCIRAWMNHQPVSIRNPKATRPWQHVLEPLSGYMNLAAQLDSGRIASGESFNFGPASNADYPVLALLEALSSHWPGAQIQFQTDPKSTAKEANFLKLDSSKALERLRWKSVLNFDETAQWTIAWYRAYDEKNHSPLAHFTTGQIHAYQNLARERGLSWAAQK